MKLALCTICLCWMTVILHGQSLIHQHNFTNTELVKKLYDNCLWGLSDMKGTEHLPAVYESVNIQSAGKYFLVETIQDSKKKYYLLSDSKVHLLQYQQVKILTDEVLAVGSAGKWGIISYKGQGLSLMQYTEVKPLGKEYLSVSQNGKWGVINVKGAEVFPCIYKDLKYWGKHQFWCKEQTGYQCMTAANKSLGFIASEVLLAPGYAFVKKKGLWTLINTDLGNTASPAFGEVKWLNDTLALVLKASDTTYALLNVMSSELIKLNDVSRLDTKDKTTPFYAVQKGSKAGVINTKGEEVLSAEFESVQLLDSFIAARLKTGWQLYSYAGKRFGTINYMNIKAHPQGLLILEEGKWGMLNSNGSLRFKPSLQQLKPIGTYFTYVLDGKVGLANDKGEMTTPAYFDYIQPIEDYFKATVAGKSIYITGENKRLYCDGEPQDRP